MITVTLVMSDHLQFEYKIVEAEWGSNHLSDSEIGDIVFSSVRLPVNPPGISYDGGWYIVTKHIKAIRIERDGNGS